MAIKGKSHLSPLLKLLKNRVLSWGHQPFEKRELGKPVKLCTKFRFCKVRSHSDLGYHIYGMHPKDEIHSIASAHARPARVVYEPTAAVANVVILGVGSFCRASYSGFVLRMPTEMCDECSGSVLQRLDYLNHHMLACNREMHVNYLRFALHVRALYTLPFVLVQHAVQPDFVDVVRSVAVHCES